MDVILVMFREDGERRSFSLTKDVTVIGRREDADLRIPLSDVSRKHCRLMKDGDYLIVEDLGSSNGTYVNGQRIHEAELHPGDQLFVGPMQFVVQINGQPDDRHLKVPAGVAVAPVNRSVPPLPVIPPALNGQEETLEEVEELQEITDEAHDAGQEVPADDLLIVEDHATSEDDIIVDLEESEETR